ncbi:MAG: hypothetical protein MRZ13_05305 [Clostridiales bacterium]|nr:hypothetical protein [Clostridiales bacterium]
MNNSTERLGTGKILPLVFRLTIPAVIAQLITFLYNAVDRIYVAKIGGSGTDALAARNKIERAKAGETDKKEKTRSEASRRDLVFLIFFKSAEMPRNL